MRRKWIGFAAAVVVLVVGYAWLAAHPPTVALPPPPAIVGDVTLIVYDEGAGAKGRSVFVHDANGALFSSHKTGDDGRLKAAIPKGAMVTVEDPSSVRRYLTVTGVEPGDDMMIGEVEDESVAKRLGAAKISLPRPHPRAAKHVATLGVGLTELPDPTKPTSLTILARYVEDGTFPVLAEANDARGEPIAFAFTRAAPPDGGDVDVRLPEWSTDYRTFHVHVAGGDGAEISGELAIASGEDRFPRGKRSGADLVFSAPRPLGTEAHLRVTAERGGSRFVLREERRSMPDKIDVDVAAPSFPRIEDVSVVQGARPTVRWKTTAGKHDVTVVRVIGQVQWTILAAPDAKTEIVLPALPSAYPALGNVTAAVALLETSFYESYGDVKKKGLGLLEDPPEADVETIRYAAFGDIDF